MYPAGLVALYGVNPNAPTTLAEVINPDTGVFFVTILPTSAIGIKSASPASLPKSGKSFVYIPVIAIF
jgi:hypothetical protein